METRILDRWLVNYKRFEIGSNTYQQYKRQILKLYKYVQEKKSYSSESEIILSVDCDMAEDYISNLILKGFKLSTLNVAIEVAKEFYNYIVKRHMILNNPFDVVECYSKIDIEACAIKKKYITVDEMKKILNAIESRTYKARSFDFVSTRDKFLLGLMYCTGLRSNEVLQIRLDWVKPHGEGYIINIPSSIVKNKMNKSVPMPKSIIGYYNNYIVERKNVENKMTDKGLLFCSINYKPMNRRNLNDLINKYVERAGIDKEISSHCFRGSLTRNLTAKDVNPSLIRKVVGWREQGVEGYYNGEANDSIYNDIKLEICDLLG